MNVTLWEVVQNIQNNTMKNIFNFLRSLKSKLTIDNCFDGFFGAFLAVISLFLYYQFSCLPLIVVVAFPVVLSVLNEFVNMYCGEKYFSFIDVAFRSIIPILLYLTILL